MMTMLKQPAAGTFLGDCVRLYEEMIAAIKVCKQEKQQEEERVQACFEIAGLYKEKINTAVRGYDFQNPEDEVFFFKHIKPLFQAEVEFYTYCYHIILFKTKDIEDDKRELDSFYKRQLLRKEKLQKEHPEFYNYVLTGQTFSDVQWFTRHNKSRDSSLYDTLMGRYLALEKFEDYLRAIIVKEF